MSWNRHSQTLLVRLCTGQASGNQFGNFIKGFKNVWYFFLDPVFLIAICFKEIIRDVERTEIDRWIDSDYSSIFNNSKKWEIVYFVIHMDMADYSMV